MFVVTAPGSPIAYSLAVEVLNTVVSANDSNFEPEVA